MPNWRPTFDPEGEHHGVAIAGSVASKLGAAAFREDVQPLVSTDIDHDPATALETVHRELISRLPGKPWKGLGG